MEEITRLVWPTEDVLICTCGAKIRIEPLRVALNRVMHNCEEDTWVIPTARHRSE